MADVRSVLNHLLDGRAELVAEVDRLTAAIADLDAVIGRLGGDDPVATSPARSVSGARRVLSRRAADGSTAPAGEGGKSIRIHVLEMLESERREMGLAEIIDRIHAAGIRAHDDAVRSITIKLMKDGKVERVGRGHYRLAGDAAAPTTSAEPRSHETRADPTPPDGPDTTGYTPPLNLGRPWPQR